MTGIDNASIDQLARAPLGAAFLVVAKESGLRPEEVADPSISLQIAAVASDWISVWRSNDHGRTVRHVLERGPELVGFGHDIVAAGDCSWWTAPSAGTVQVYNAWGLQGGKSPSPTDIRGPESAVGMPNSWEQYAQKPKSLMTASYIEDTSSILVGVGYESNDWLFRGEGPIPAWKLNVSPQARVFEVLGPAQWHELCTHYSAVAEDRNSPAFGLLVPDWSAVRQDWDGVHLTFFGWLTAEQSRFTDGRGSSMHWGWEAEATVWLRWVFSSVSPWPDCRLPTQSKVIREPHLPRT